MPDSSPNDVAWSLIADQVAASAHSGQRRWIPQPELSLDLLEILRPLKSAQLEIFHSFRPSVEALKSKGYRVQTELSAGPWDLVFFVPTRQRTESLGLLAHGLLNLAPGGALYFACPNSQGAGGYLSRLKELFPEIQAESGRKCRWLVISADQIRDRVPLETWIREAGPSVVPETEFHSFPGIYGWNKVDRGSELLISTLPELKGSGIDLGSGYGYLSHSVLSRATSSVSRLSLLEADARALESSRENLKSWGDVCQFYWLDALSSEARSLPKVDWVLMNPPFHEGAQSDSDLGRAFIETAAHLLKEGGRLYMVANAFLGYEKVLQSRFRQVERLMDKDGFKVIHALR